MLFFQEEISEILGLINWNDSKKKSLQFKSISIDSRTISSGDLFIAIKGKNYDGHDFVNEVFNKGIKAVVVKRGYEKYLPQELPFWCVPDSLEAFQKIALLKRRKLRLPVVAITGSVGKTTTKEMIGEVLKKFGKVQKSKANYNNEIGLGLTIINCEENNKALVLEMGMRGLGQIENLSRFSEPNIAVITNIGSSHIGILGSKENIAFAKCEITKHLHPNGVVIIPYGDNLLESALKETWNGRIVRIQLTNNLNDYQLLESSDNLISGYYDSQNNLIKVDSKTFRLSFYGRHNALNFLFAYATSKEFRIKFRKHNEFKFNSIEGRNRILKTGKITIFDETYNASPESVKACVEVLIKQKGKQFLILGSMRELGKMSLQFHMEILNYIYLSSITRCIFLHEFDEKSLLKDSKYLREKIYFVENINDVIPIINKWINKGDYLLIKGSRNWELEKIIPLID